jgi:hypothetical protein
MPRSIQLIMLGGWLVAEPLWAGGVTVVPKADGSVGVIRDLGGGTQAYADSQGNVGGIAARGTGPRPFEFSSPQGGGQSGILIPFGSGAHGSATVLPLIRSPQPTPDREEQDAVSREEESRESFRSR